MKRRELEAGGLETDAAARAARRAVGNVPLTHNKVRDVWIWPWLQDAGQDLRYGVRALRNNPGLTATVVLTLALGLGVNASTFAPLRTAPCGSRSRTQPPIDSFRSRSKDSTANISASNRLSWTTG